MRWGTFILIFLLFASVYLKAQDLINNSVRIENIPSEGILLNKGWKFQVGDDLEWAKQEFDDRDWQAIDPTKDIYDLPQLQKGIGWFRLHLSLDSSVWIKQLVLMLQQSGASEIYLNGQLMYHFGALSNNPKHVKAYDPLWKPILFSANGEQQVLAVRYALQPKLHYTTMFETANPALWIKVMDLDKAISLYHQQYSLIRTLGVAYIAVFLLFTILHFAFYLFYPAQKANLYFALYTLLFLNAAIVQDGFFYLENWVARKFYLGNIAFALMLVSQLFLLTAIYKLLEQKRDAIYRALIVFVGISIFLNAWAYGWGWQVGGALAFFLIQLNIARVAFLALRKKKRGAWIIVAGTISYLLFFFIFMSQGTLTNRMFLLNVSFFRMATNLLAIVSIPAATSIYLGLEFAFVNRSLQQKLDEVEDLSQKTIQQEKEKQHILASQKETLEKQVTERTAQLKQSLEELKATQAQLVQREKMASLGELTAGIAHEIQNPLNFVNNFSEVNIDLIDELKETLQSGKTNEASAVADEIKENNQKITYHGKRADSIVKGMLQHSRSSTGQKEPTDINALVDECLRLSYHGIRSKEKSFNALLEIDLDSSIEKINVVPQDIGQVLLNLLSNAFYSVVAKKKHLNGAFEPAVYVHTRKSNGNIEICIRDNGWGIPKPIEDKIFQPFFTSKPTGEGTGLGLSLSYDIITKGHNGQIKVETEEGQWAQFTVLLPV